MTNPRGADSVEYKDIRLFLILIPLINALNYYLTYSNIQFNQFTLITYLVDTIQGYLSWWLIRMLIIRLDRSFAYEEGLVRRLVWQILLSILLGLGFIIASTEVLNWGFRDTPVPDHFYTFDLFIFLIWILALNTFYVGRFYYLKFLEISRSDEVRLQDDQQEFIIKQNKGSIRIPFAEVIAVVKVGEYSQLLTATGGKHYLDDSLTQIELLLPGEHFFRLNRQHLVHRSIIRSFSKELNGKLSVDLSETDGLLTSVTVSRTKAPAFKKWFSANLK